MIIQALVLLVLTFARVDAYLFSTPPHEQLKSIELNFDHVLSVDESFKQQIITSIRQFPWNGYDVYHVPEMGLFCIDQHKSHWIKDILKQEQIWEPHIVPLIKKYVKPGTVAIDAGAHIGTQTLIMARAVGDSGKVYAFEPQPKTFRELFINCNINGAPNVYCYWAALLDKKGEIELPNFISECEVVYLFDFSYGHSGIIAPATTLDSLELENVSFIKVDVDGCEDAFLDGAKNTILSNKPVLVIEILGGANIDTATPEQYAMIMKTKAKLIDLGYQIERVGVHDYLAIPL
jgi:FkbM family methyltransferase